MYYGYNSFTGRLIGANRMKAYAPQGETFQVQIIDYRFVSKFPIGLQRIDTSMYRYIAYGPERLTSTWWTQYSYLTIDFIAKAAPTQGSAGQAGAVRAASGATAAHGSSYGKVPERILRIRAKLQKAEHLPVHLKGGTFDFALFYLTAALAVTGLVGAVATILKLSVPQKPADS